MDLFAPPEAAADPVVELADDEIAHRARKRMTTPPVAAPEPVRRSAPSLSVAPELGSGRLAPPGPAVPPASMTPGQVLTPTLAPKPSARALPELPGPATGLADPRRLLASPRARFVVGVVLAIVLGFIPADIVASLRERSALRAVDARVVAVQAAADSEDSYDALDAFRADQVEAKRSKRRMIALTSLLIWAAASGTLGYVWFWRIRWERFDPR